MTFTSNSRIWRQTIRVYYDDTDGGGVVYYANYLKFAERARSEILREAGMQPSTLAKKRGVVFVVTHCACSYRRPARLDDLLVVETSCLSCSGVRLELAQNVVFDNARDNTEAGISTSNIVAELRVTLALVDIRAGVGLGKPQRLSADMLSLFQPHSAKI